MTHSSSQDLNPTTKFVSPASILTLPRSPDSRCGKREIGAYIHLAPPMGPRAPR